MWTRGCWSVLGHLQSPRAAPGGGSGRDGDRCCARMGPGPGPDSFHGGALNERVCEELSKQAGLLHSCEIWPYESLKDLLFSGHCWTQSDRLDIGRK